MKFLKKVTKNLGYFYKKTNHEELKKSLIWSHCTHEQRLCHSQPLPLELHKLQANATLSNQPLMFPPTHTMEKKNVLSAINKWSKFCSHVEPKIISLRLDQFYLIVHQIYISKYCFGHYINLQLFFKNGLISRLFLPSKCLFQLRVTKKVKHNLINSNLQHLFSLSSEKNFGR